MKKKVRTNEQAFKNLLKDLDPISLALLRERILTICEYTANNSEEISNSFINPRLYVDLNEVVQKHLGFEEQ
jgi:hypothetical protein